MRKIISFWFKVSSTEDPNNLTEDIDTEINDWAQNNGATIVSTSMCVEPIRNTLYVIVVYET